MSRLLPDVFAVGFLGLPVYGWQARVMRDVVAGKKVVCRTPNGAGKTAIIVAALTLCVAHEWPGATCVLTSATFAQLKEQVFDAMHVHGARFPGWTFNETEIESPNGSRIIGRATDRGGRFEGFHAYPDRPLLIVVDEAKSVADEIKTAVDRCNPTMFLAISSPGGQSGWFFEAFRQPRVYTPHAITLQDCPHLANDAQRIEEMRALYGEGSEIFRSMMLGEFGNGDDDGMVIPLGMWESCMRRGPKPDKAGERRFFCDFADAGGDENCLAMREGNVVSIVDAWVQEGDKAAAKDANVMRYHRHFQRLGVQDGELYGDLGGIGHGYIFALRELGWRVIPVDNGEAAQDAHYFNRAAEMWWHLRRQMGDGLIVLPDDPKLKAELLSRRWAGWVKSATGERWIGREDGRIQLEPKRLMRGKSPNRGDAVVGVVWPNAWGQPRSLIAKATGFDRWEDAQFEEQASGFDAGY